MMDARLLLALGLTIGGTGLASERRTCTIPGKDVVQFARRQGYGFDATLTSPAGSCWFEETGTFVVSAADDQDVACMLTMFTGKKPYLDSAMASILVVRNPDGTTHYPTRRAASDGGGWRLTGSTTKGNAVQYRLESVDFDIKDCKTWQVVLM